MIKDMAGNALAELPSSAALLASAFVDDSVRPMVLSFDLNMNSEQLTIHFSEVVDASTLDFESITLLRLNDLSSVSSDKLTLTDGARAVESDELTVIINITQEDMDVMKTRKIGVDESSVFMTVTSGLIKDMNGLAVLPVNEVTALAASAMPVTSYTDDNTAPKLLSCALNMQDAELTLSFSETVDASTLTVGSLTVQQNADSSGAAHTLVSPSGTDARAATDVPTVIVDLATADMNAIKKLASSGLALGEESVHCSHTRALINDVFGVPVVARDDDTALASNDYTPDETSPKLVSFDLNMNEYITENHVAVASASISFVFDETIDFSTYHANNVTLQSTSNASNAIAESVQLSGFFENVTTDDGTTLSFTLQRADVNVIKALKSLAISDASTFVSLPAEFIKDMYGNMLVPVPSDEAVKVTNFGRDTIAPQLLRFNIDLDKGQMKFVFDETVKGASIQPNELVLRDTSDPTMQTVNYTLTGGFGDDGVTPWTYAVDTDTFPHADGTEVVLIFTKADLDEIKRLSFCTKDAAGNDCFLVHTEFFVDDMRGNKITRCT
jgi:hypothetical protein